MLHVPPSRTGSPRPSLADMRRGSSGSVASVGSGYSQARSTRPLLLRPESAMSVQSFQSARSGRTDLSAAQAEVQRAVRMPMPQRPSYQRLQTPPPPARSPSPAASVQRHPTIRSDVWVPPLLEAVRTPSGLDYPPANALVLAPPTVDIPETEHGWRRWVGLVLPILSASIAISMVVGLGYAISLKVRHPNA